jgi:hypothetical protein
MHFHLQWFYRPLTYCFASECKEIQERRQMNRILSRPGKSIEGFETIKPENVYMMDTAKPPDTENTVQFAFNANH